MNAFNNVNVAGACIITSTEVAEQLGIPKNRWIYPLGGAGTRDAYSCKHVRYRKSCVMINEDAVWERPNFYSSPSISQSLDAGLAASKITKDEIDLFDFYSYVAPNTFRWQNCLHIRCFPIVPKLACHHLGLPLTGGRKPITLLGGLTSFGGAGNNYSMHAITEMVRQLRDGNGRTGLILANGGTVTYQHVVCLSSSPRADGSAYPDKNPLPETLEDEPHPKVSRDAEGEVVIEVRADKIFNAA